MFSAKLWFLKTSTRIIKYKLRVVKSYLAVYFYHYKIFHLIKLSDPAPVPWKIYKNVFFKSFLRVWIWSGKCLSEILFHVKTMPLPLIRSPSKGGVNWTEGGGGSEKQKGDGSMVQGQFFLKEWKGGWYFPYLIFSRLIIFTFRNYYVIQFCFIYICIWTWKYPIIYNLIYL